jgi:cytochrome c oxidase cbb3-type subunit 4
MTTYHLMADFARTEGLLYFVLIFVGMLGYVLRPGAKRHFDDAAAIPFKED